MEHEPNQLAALRLVSPSKNRAKVNLHITMFYLEAANSQSEFTKECE